MKRKKLLCDDEGKKKCARTGMGWVAKLTKEESYVYTVIAGSDLGKNVPNLV